MGKQQTETSKDVILGEELGNHQKRQLKELLEKLRVSSVICQEMQQK